MVSAQRRKPMLAAGFLVPIAAQTSAASRRRRGGLLVRLLFPDRSVYLALSASPWVIAIAATMLLGACSRDADGGRAQNGRGGERKSPEAGYVVLQREAVPL